MDNAVSYILGFLPTIITGVLVFIIQQKIKKQDSYLDKQDEIRKKESALQLKMIMAGNMLSYAVAMAVKRGEPNGEVEEAVKAYNEAKDDYYMFLNEVVSKRLSGGI